MGPYWYKLLYKSYVSVLILGESSTLVVGPKNTFLAIPNTQVNITLLEKERLAIEAEIECSNIEPEPRRICNLLKLYKLKKLHKGK